MRELKLEAGGALEDYEITQPSLEGVFCHLARREQQWREDGLQRVEYQDMAPPRLFTIDRLRAAFLRLGGRFLSPTREVYRRTANIASSIEGGRESDDDDLLL